MLEVDGGTLTATLCATRRCRSSSWRVTGPVLDGHGNGTIEFDGTSLVGLQLRHHAGRSRAARGADRPRRDGPAGDQGTADRTVDRLQLAGDATLPQLDGVRRQRLDADLHYDATVPSGDAARATARKLSGTRRHSDVFGQPLQQRVRRR